MRRRAHLGRVTELWSCSIADDKLEASQVRKRRILQDTDELWCCCSSSRYCLPSGNTPCASRRLLLRSGVGLASIRLRVSYSGFSQERKPLCVNRMHHRIDTIHFESRPTDHKSRIRPRNSPTWSRRPTLRTKNIPGPLQRTKRSRRISFFSKIKLDLGYNQWRVLIIWLSNS